MPINIPQSNENFEITVNETQPSGTSGGAASTTWAARNLNTVVNNTISGALLSSNRITLPAGRYKINCISPAYVIGYKSRLYNVTLGSAILNGQTTWGSGNAQLSSLIQGTFTLNVESELEIQHIASAVGSGSALGVNAGIAGNDNIFTTAIIQSF